MREKGWFWLNKQKILILVCLVLLFAAALGLVAALHKKNTTESGFQASLRASHTDAAYEQLQAGRSEQFPVIGYETSVRWMIALIYDEEVFYLSFNDSAAAKTCYLDSLQEYGPQLQGKMYLCRNDIVYYKGSDSRIIDIISNAAQDNNG